MHYPLVMLREGIPMHIYICLYTGLTMLSTLYFHPNWMWYYLSQTVIRVPFIISYKIHSPYYIHSVFSNINVCPHYFHMYSRSFRVMLYVEILTDDPWYLTWYSPVCLIDAIIIHSGEFYTCSSSLHIVSHLVLITAII